MKEVLTKFCANKDNRYLLLICFFLFSFFLFLNVATPETLDDYIYKFRFLENGSNRSCPINNISDVFLSQVEHYHQVNGRFIVHFVIQLFSGIIGKPIFNLLNSVAFLAFIYMLVKYTMKEVTAMRFLIVSLAVVFLLPCFNNCFLWMSGAINYLWSGLAVLFYLYVLNQFKDKDISWKYFAIGVLALFLGWTHEGISFPLALSSLFYILFFNKKRFRSASFPLILFFLIGSLLCAFSPSTMSRGGFDSTIGIMTILSRVVNGLSLLAHLKSFVFLALLILYCLIRRKRIVKLDDFSIIIVGGIIFSMGIVLISGFSTGRAAFGLELCCLMMVLRILSDMKMFNFAKITFLVFSFLFAVVLAYSSNRNMSICNNLIEDVKSTKDGVVIYDELVLPSYMEGYIQSPMTQSHSGYYMCYSENYWENEYMASSYKKDRLVFLPVAFMQNIRKGDAYNEFDVKTDLPFYCKKLSEGESVKGVKFLLRECYADEIPFYYRPIADRLDRFSATNLECDKWAVQEVYGQRYVMITKNALIDNRLIGIELIH